LLKKYWYANHLFGVQSMAGFGLAASSLSLLLEQINLDDVPCLALWRHGGEPLAAV
jgi:hypothetical protein